MLFLGIISWKGTSRFNGRGLFFRWGGFIVKCGGGVSHGMTLILMGGARKNCWMGEAPPHTPPTMGNPDTLIKKGLLEEMEGVNDNTSAFMHLNIKINNGKKLLFKPS